MEKCWSKPVQIDGVKRGTIVLRREPKVGSRVWIHDPDDNVIRIFVVEDIDDSMIILKRKEKCQKSI